MRALPFVLSTLVICALFALAREVHPWTILSIAGWSIAGWIAMALVAAVIGLFTA